MTSLTVALAFGLGGDETSEPTYPPLPPLAVDQLRDSDGAGVYGTDISTASDLDSSFALVSGPRAVLESIVRRLQTPRGALPFYPDDGLDVSEALHDGLSSAGLFALKSRIEAECTRDERVLDAEVTLAFAGEALDVTLVLELTEGTSRAVLRVTDLDIQILQLE